ncbi:hypothetical protein HPB48_023593 [Haemaphysalis longicornis]|uniref:ribonuclease H n=1 Tax=Haemaphysalis longicornis TaxID=44386 RepID=A0A9J6H6G7_HAELO|nr:hypothetical protein HPB48_023593 [Haemaphysalis longicornis]
MGKIVAQFEILIGETSPIVHYDPTPPNSTAPIQVNTSLPGGRSKRNAPHCALRQDTEERLHDHFNGFTQIFTDGSVLDGRCSATAACIIPSTGARSLCHLQFNACSTTAEIAGLHLACDLISNDPDIQKAVILTDSRAALSRLASPRKATPAIKSLLNKALLLSKHHGKLIAFQWVPSHVGIPGNEAADTLAKEGHNTPTTPCTDVARIDEARLIIRRELCSLLPDPRIASGLYFHPYHTRAFPAMKWASSSVSELAPIGTPPVSTGWASHKASCRNCTAEETLQHLLLECPQYSGPRSKLLATFVSLRLTHTRPRISYFPRPTPQYKRKHSGPSSPS